MDNTRFRLARQVYPPLAGGASCGRILESVCAELQRVRSSDPGKLSASVANNILIHNIITWCTALAHYRCGIRFNPKNPPAGGSTGGGCYSALDGAVHILGGQGRQRVLRVRVRRRQAVERQLQLVRQRCGQQLLHPLRQLIGYVGCAARFLFAFGCAQNLAQLFSTNRRAFFQFH